MKPRLVETSDEEHDARYRTYERWSFYWHTGFTTIPMCRWEWWPDLCWGDWERSLRFLWLTFTWSKSWTYEEKKEWVLQNDINRLVNQKLDNDQLPVYDHRKLYGKFR